MGQVTPSAHPFQPVNALVVSAPADIRADLQQKPPKQRVARARRWRDRDGDDVAARATRQALRDLVGVGVHNAARLLVAVGDNAERIHSEPAFAHLCRAAPTRASSGKSTRHRLNRGGDRSANHALWRIVMVRRVYDERTRAFVARRTAEGLSDREITRRLKRYIAREVHRALTGPLELGPRSAELRRLRTAVGLPMRIVAEHLHVGVHEPDGLRRIADPRGDLVGAVALVDHPADVRSA